MDNCQDAFALAETPVKILLKHYFENKNKEIYPQCYRDHANLIKISPILDKKLIDRKSLICYPSECAYIPVPTSLNEDKKTYWNLKLQVFDYNDVINEQLTKAKPTIELFCNVFDGDDESKMHVKKRIIQHIAMMFGSTVEVMQYLKNAEMSTKKNEELLRTITLEQDETTKTLCIKDSRFPNRKPTHVIGYSFDPVNPEDMIKAKNIESEKPEKPEKPELQITTPDNPIIKKVKNEVNSRDKKNTKKKKKNKKINAVSDK